MPRKVMKKFTKEERRNALMKGFANRDKRGGVRFTVDESELTKLGVKKFENKSGGTSYITIIPRTDAPEYYQEIFVHYNVGVNKDAYLCPNRMYGESCPVCEFGRKLHDEGEPVEVTKEYFPRKHAVMWVVDSEDKHAISDGVQLFVAPKTIFDAIADLSTDGRTGATIDISDPEERITFAFRKTGTGLTTKYSGFVFEDWQNEIPPEYYEDLPCMDDILVKPDVSALNKAVGNINLPETNNDDEIDDEDENTLYETDNDDVIEEEEEDIEEVEEVEEPVARVRKRSRTVTTGDDEVESVKSNVKQTIRSRTRGKKERS